MTSTLTVTEPQVDRLAQKLDAMNLTFEEQAILVTVLMGEKSEIFKGAPPADQEEDMSRDDVNLPTPGEGLRNAFIAGTADSEVNGYGGGVCLKIH